jgi:hypothetical protein
MRGDTVADTGTDVSVDWTVYDSERGGWQPGGMTTTIALGSGVSTADLGYLAYQLFKGAKPMSWYVFPGPFDDNDQIEYAEADGVPDTLTWTLINAHSKTLWTAVEVYDSTGAMRGSAWTINPGSSSTASVVSPDFSGWFMVFKKAKFWGIHTSMYVNRDLQPKSGKSVTFTWTVYG